mmetsp:Transcript_4923/g.14243  ORF Transcript_4923/g.14243 Transcript_4923/m.14243 type:complete len:286 (+) Transcript_4923:5746-6603(+)
MVVRKAAATPKSCTTTCFFLLFGAREEDAAIPSDVVSLWSIEAIFSSEARAALRRFRPPGAGGERALGGGVADCDRDCDCDRNCDCDRDCDSDSGTHDHDDDGVACFDDDNSDKNDDDDDCCSRDGRLAFVSACRSSSCRYSNRCPRVQSSQSLASFCVAQSIIWTGVASPTASATSEMEKGANCGLVVLVLILVLILILVLMEDADCCGRCCCCFSGSPEPGVSLSAVIRASESALGFLSPPMPPLEGLFSAAGAEAVLLECREPCSVCGVYSVVCRLRKSVPG